ncbi:hypothetical protein IFM89_033530 [Coptis chinensis]|uniref:PAP/OAS1 substrate-binding domain superfamily n=1 Tax=Coptis chinensis TaxID=261450 RepID=A0A835H6P2_9MAGN|nr:hypothetical protein IFM89_033530 [Coptis chinensis]
MGDLEALSIQPNGFSIEERVFSPSSLSLSNNNNNNNPNPSSVSEECWFRAEEITEEIITQIQPTVVSEQRRKAVIEYVQSLIGGYLGSEVFPFGSVPLKTYLPDGDIDLTALSVQSVEDALANDVRAVLEREEQNEGADFEVKDVQYINAEVKLIKCLVENIVVDISFNQLGGLCTLCFLEQVDRDIVKNHLFKRSIILIKAWCYYESRILGAHHGLISTYALETMVLYIFHLFHSSLNGPLAVLYRFLDYYSKFDWDNYCINLSGPVSISSLPEIVAETPDNGGDALLLDMRKYVDMFSVPSRSHDINSRSFQQKHFNIVDPLKENNNLGRSVSKGNFYRIRSAFTYGARKLGQILLLPSENIADELHKFFLNTLDRHGSGQRPDVQVSVPPSNVNGSDQASLQLEVEKLRRDETVLNPPSVGSTSPMGESKFYSQGLLQEGISNIQLSGLHKKASNGTGKEPQRSTTGLVSSLELLERFGYIKENGISGHCSGGDAEELATSRVPGSIVTNGRSECTSPSCEVVNSSLGRAYYTPHLYLSPSFQENGKIATRHPDLSKAKSSALYENKFSSRPCQGPHREIDTAIRKDSEASVLRTNHKFDLFSESSDTAGKLDGQWISGLVDPVCWEDSSTSTSGALNSLSDLGGDFDNHIHSLICARNAFFGLYMPIPPLISHFQNKNACDSLRRSMQLKHNVFPHMKANGVVSTSHFFPLNPPIIPGAAFGMDEKSKTRGTGTYIPNTGTYIPNTSYRPHKERSLPGRKNELSVPHGQFLRTLRDNNGAATTELNFIEKDSYELPPEQFPPLPSRGKPAPPAFVQDNCPVSRVSSHSNGVSHPSEKVEFGSFRQGPPVVPSSEASMQPVSSTQTQAHSSDLPTVTMPRPRPVSAVNVEGYLP